MAVIVILVDSEAGHILPVNKLALGLKLRGHRVCYAGFTSGGSIVRMQGFEFFPVLEGKLTGERDMHFGPLTRGEALDDLFSKLNPNVVLIGSLFALEGLVIKYRYQIPAVLFRTDFSPITREGRGKMVADRLNEIDDGKDEFLEQLGRNNLRINSIDEVSSLAEKIPELVFLPKGFERHHEDSSPYLYYVGHAVDIHRKEEEFNWNQLDSKPIIYASFGSQSHLRPELSFQWGQRLARAFSNMPEYNLILNAGRPSVLENSAPVPDNVLILPFVPQMTVLKRASMMINHAGIGSVRECIALGVPMVLSPMMRDQFMCAERVAEHGLGKVVSLTDMTDKQIIEAVRSTINDKEIKRNVETMRGVFKRSENIGLGISVIESAINNNK